MVQANASLLDACITMLGEETTAGETRSDKIRRMLRLTDKLRRYNADLIKHGVPVDFDDLGVAS